MPSSRRSATEACVGPLGELLAVLAEQEPVVDHLGQLAAERARDPLLHLLVRPVVGAADDVGDAEVEVVDDGRELIGGGAVRARQRRPGEPDRPVRVADRAGFERERRCLGVTLGPLALPDRPLVPADPEPARDRRGSPPRRRGRCAPDRCRRSAGRARHRARRRTRGWRRRSARCRGGATRSGSVRSGREPAPAPLTRRS